LWIKAFIIISTFLPAPYDRMLWKSLHNNHFIDVFIIGEKLGTGKLIVNVFLSKYTEKKLLIDPKNGLSRSALCVECILVVTVSFTHMSFVLVFRFCRTDDSTTGIGWVSVVSVSYPHQKWASQGFFDSSEVKIKLLRNEMVN